MEESFTPYAELLTRQDNREKSTTTALIFALLKSTGAYDDLESMCYVRGKEAGPYGEAVLVKWEDKESVPINVNMDSCLALIKDVNAHLEETRHAKE